MTDLKLQMQCFALIGKARLKINNWLVKGDRSPGSEKAMRIRLQAIIDDIDLIVGEYTDNPHT